MPVKPIPDGFHAVTPYLFTQGAARLIEFIEGAFSGELTARETRPDGAITHAEMRVGDSMLMLADATPRLGRCPPPSTCMCLIRIAVYQPALEAGGVSVFPIMTLP